MKKSQALSILGLEEGFTPEELKQAHRKKVRESHPDRFAQDPVKKAQAEETTKLINEARDVLESGKWEPEGGYSYGNPYAGGNPYANGNPYAGQTQYVWQNGTWTVYTNGDPNAQPFSGQPFEGMPFDPFNPFGARPSTEATARRAYEIATANLRSTIITLVVLIGLCGFFGIQGNVFGACIMFALLVSMNMLLTRVGGCMWILAIPVLFEALRMGTQHIQAGTGQLIFGGIIFAIAILAEIRDVKRIIAHYKKTKEAYEKIVAEKENSSDSEADSTI